MSHDSSLSFELSSISSSVDGSPGDGVCPPASYLKQIHDAAYERWTQAASTVPQDSSCKNDFLNLLSSLPCLKIPPLQGLRLEASLALGADFVLRLQTSLHPNCTQRYKDLSSYMNFGSSSWKIYRTRAEDPQKEYRHLTRLVLAWSYILCRRWVEVLAASGADAVMWHQDQDSDIWEILRTERWRATIKYSNKEYYSPFMVRSDVVVKADELPETPSSIDATSVLATISKFCVSHGCVNECYLALATVLLFRSFSVPSPQLPEWTDEADHKDMASPCENHYNTLAPVIDQCLSLGCASGGVDTLMGTTFFDPSLPCNVVGAQWLGIKRAVNLTAVLDFRTKFSRSDFSPLVNAVTLLAPDLALFWSAAATVDQARRLVMKSTGDVCVKEPWINLWTKKPNSFFHVQYDSVKDETTISRALEFGTAYFVQPDLHSPLSRSPPFGDTLISNAEFYWVMLDGHLEEAFPPCRYQCPHVKLWRPFSTSEESETPEPREWNHAMIESCNDTSQIFAWHATMNGGLWLDDGTFDGAEAVRAFQAHPWLGEDYSDLIQGVQDEEESEKGSFNYERILAWRDSVPAEKLNSLASDRAMYAGELE